MSETGQKRKRNEHGWMCDSCGVYNTDSVCRWRRCRKPRPKDGDFVQRSCGTGLIRVVEFYCGIGGMHCALNEDQQSSSRRYNVVAAYDINDNARSVYTANFPATPVFGTDIMRLSLKELEYLNASLWLLSPPCQPYTRQGDRKGSEDSRAQSFLSMIDLLPLMENPPSWILVENVLGFEASETFQQLVVNLKKANFTYQALHLNATSIGIPNSRPRMYVLAKAPGFTFAVPSATGEVVLDSAEAVRILQKAGVVHQEIKPETIKERLRVLPSSDSVESFLVPDSQLAKALPHSDIVTSSSFRSGCFTKSYGRRGKGCGSVLLQEGSVDAYHREAHAIADQNTDSHGSFKEFSIRYFVPREVAALLGYPGTFVLPEDLLPIQHFRLLGNSLSVSVVARLVSYLLQEPSQLTTVSCPNETRESGIPTIASETL
ncbi:cytosine-5-methyltransferase [Diplonema papillatum]|nr:cytosine-5-methyltransferase [Diplonema papillatum]